MGGEQAAVLVVLFGGSGESLKYRPAGVGAELEAAGAVELFRCSQQGHTAFTDQIGELYAGVFCLLDHRQDQSHIGGHYLAAAFQLVLMFFQQSLYIFFFPLSLPEQIATMFAHLMADVVHLKEQDLLFFCAQWDVRSSRNLMFHYRFDCAFLGEAFIRHIRYWGGQYIFQCSFVNGRKIQPVDLCQHVF